MRIATGGAIILAVVLAIGNVASADTIITREGSFAFECAGIATPPARFTFLKIRRWASPCATQATTSTRISPHPTLSNTAPGYGAQAAPTDGVAARRAAGDPAVRGGRGKSIVGALEPRK